MRISDWSSDVCSSDLVINGEKGFDQVIVDGNPMFPQRPRITVPSPFGGHYSAQFKGKLLYMQHTHDTSLWPDQAILYAEGVARYGTPENFRLQWVEKDRKSTRLNSSH